MPDAPAPLPKIELHVHLEGTVGPDLLRRIARRNDVALPDDLEQLYAFDDFAQFVEAYTQIASALRTERDFREVTCAYAQQAAAHGCVYVEAIFSPADVVRGGATWEAVFAGYCDGAQQAFEEHGVRVLLTPDISRQFTDEEARLVARHALRHRDRGVVGLGLGGLEAEHPPERFERVFAEARAGGLASVPHGGEMAGAGSVRGCLHALGAHRIRHGIRAVEDPSLVDELAASRVVLDVCPISNLRTGAVARLADHPLPRLLDAGVGCTLGTDDPALFDTDLTREHAPWRGRSRAFFEAGVEGALCDEGTRARLRALIDATDWPG